MSTKMTTNQKLFFLFREKGMAWGEIASCLGVSRQMICAVRAGKKRFGDVVEKRLDDLISSSQMTTSVNQENQLPHDNQTVDKLFQGQAQLLARLESLDARVSSVERLLLRLLAGQGGGGKKES
jgi:predicted transcriptional regulator